MSSVLYRAFLRFRGVLPTVIFMTTKTAEPLDLPAPVAAYFGLQYRFTLEGDKIARLEIAP